MSFAFRKPAYEIGGCWDWTQPVHENLTLLSLRAALESGQQQSRPYKAGALLKFVHGDLALLPTLQSKSFVDPKKTPTTTQEFLRGVTWPDDPKGWIFDSARGTKNYSSGIKWTNEFKLGDVSNREHLIKRSHYGDLQFLHSMAVDRGERASDTKSQILCWSRFNIELALGKISSSTLVQNLPERFNNIQVHFNSRCDWDIRSLLAGNKSHGNGLSQLDVQQRATGILLHLIQDSFSHSHVERGADGAIQQFHDYGSQDEHKHGEMDVMGEGKTLLERVSNMPGAVRAIGVGAQLVVLLDQPSSVDSVMDFFDKSVFKLAASSVNAGPGALFEKAKPKEPFNIRKLMRSGNSPRKKY